MAPANGDLPPEDETAEAERTSSVNAVAGDASTGVIDFTTDLLFGDSWRKALSPSDRGLITVSASVATGQNQQIEFHLDRVMDNA